MNQCDSSARVLPNLSGGREPPESVSRAEAASIFDRRRDCGSPSATSIGNGGGFHSQRGFRGLTPPAQVFLAIISLLPSLSFAGDPIDYAALLPPAIDRTIDFVKDVQPIFRQHCFECHAQGNEEGGLNLGVKARALEGGDSGAIFVATKSAESRLVQLVSGLDKESVMPPETKGLSRNEIGILRAWIDQGAIWPDGHDVLHPRIERAQKHWAFQPLREVSLPALKNEKWCEATIDRFILANLEEQQLAPTKPADPLTLARRVYFDMVGLPPTPEELDAFVADCK
jgi:mono/diheme cytochrome c family protein